MANEVRGELALTLEGVDHIMRPDFETIVDFEAATGKTVVELARASVEGQLTIREMATIAGGCIRSYGVAKEDKKAAGVNDRRIMELIVDTGPINAMKQLQRLLVLASTGGVTSSGEVKAA